MGVKDQAVKHQQRSLLGSEAGAQDTATGCKNTVLNDPHYDDFKKDILRKFVQDDNKRFRIMHYGVVMTDTPKLDATCTLREMLRSALGDECLTNIQIVVVEHDAERHQQQVEHVGVWSGPQLRLVTGDVFYEWSKKPYCLLWADLDATRLTPQQEAILQRAESPLGTISLCQRCNVGRNKRSRTIERRIRQIHQRTRGRDKAAEKEKKMVLRSMCNGEENGTEINA